jgi:hypothetical protein
MFHSARLLVAVFVAGLGVGNFQAISAPLTDNSVVRFFVGAEVQCEDSAQRADLARVLADLLHRPLEVRGLRYPDYQGRQSAWSAIEVVRHYVVPGTPQQLQPAKFYRDATSSEARKTIRQLLAQLDDD